MSKSTRIAFLSEHASPAALLGSQDAGGQNVYVDQITRELGLLGFELDIFTRQDSGEQPTVIDWAPGVRIINLRAGPACFLPKDDLWPLMPTFRDAVLDFARSQERGYQVIHGNFWMSGWVAASLKRRLGIPAVQIFHALGVTKRRQQGDADTSPAERIAVERRVVREVDHLIAQCPKERAELIEDYGADPDRIEVIPSAVSLQLFHPVDQAAARRKLQLPADDRIIVYVGRLLPRKDVRNVLRATAKISRTTDLPVRLLIVGGETTRPDPVATPEIGVLQRLARELGIDDRVIFAGKRQQCELADYYSAGDVAVTTPWYEPFGLTPLEAMACGRPVVGADVGGISYTVEDGRTGFLVPPKEPEALACRLAQLLSDPQLRMQFGSAARRRVERHFDWSISARRVALLYQRAMAEQTSLFREPLDVTGPLALASASHLDLAEPAPEE